MRMLCLFLIVLSLPPGDAGAASLDDFFEQRSFFEQHCIECHDGATKTAGLDLSQLKLRLEDRDNFALWERVHDAVAGHAMPPKQNARPAEADLAAFLAELHAK